MTQWKSSAYIQREQLCCRAGYTLIIIVNSPDIFMRPSTKSLCKAVFCSLADPQQNKSLRVNQTEPSVWSRQRRLPAALTRPIPHRHWWPSAPVSHPGVSWVAYSSRRHFSSRFGVAEVLQQDESLSVQRLCSWSKKNSLRGSPGSGSLQYTPTTRFPSLLGLCFFPTSFWPACGHFSGTALLSVSLLHLLSLHL